MIKSLKDKKPAVIRQEGEPRYVILDWKTYRAWQELREDLEDHVRFDYAKRISRGKKQYPLEEIRKKYHIL